MFNDLPCTTNRFGEIPPEVARVAHEMEALQTALLVADGRGNRKEAQLMARTYLARLEPSTTEEIVIEASLNRILGHPCAKRAKMPPLLPWEAHVADSTALAWTAWNAKDNERAVELVKALRSTRRKRREPLKEKVGAIHLLTLSFWGEATLHLVQGERRGAQRFFKRALELGSQFGTESHPMISWAYAASFFESTVRPVRQE
jgi:hypothetical protein